jgi:hypothetical protein
VTPLHIVGRRHDARYRERTGGHESRRLARRRGANARAVGSEPPSSTQIITGTVCTTFGSRRLARRGTMAGVSSGGWYVSGPGSARRRRGSAWPFLRGGPFRRIELNAVGWSTLLAPPAVAGGVASLAVGRSAALGALAGAGAAFVVAVAWDRWRWWNSDVSVSSDLDLEELQRVADRLRAEGVDVTVDAADRGPVVAPVSDREDVD